MRVTAKLTGGTIQVKAQLLSEIKVDAQTYEVSIDGEVLTSEPAEKLALAQRYFLF